MYKLYCLSWRYKVRWSCSRKFDSFYKCVQWLKFYCPFKPEWVNHNFIKFYKLVQPDNKVCYFKLVQNSDKNYLFDSDIEEISLYTDIPESDLL